MGIEARNKNGNLYYYRKRREGDRVVSEYVGGGVVASLSEYQDKRERAEREAADLQQRAAHLSIERIDQQLDEFSELVDLLVKAELLAMGYHQHKRQWRRRR